MDLVLTTEHTSISYVFRDKLILPPEQRCRAVSSCPLSEMGNHRLSRPAPHPVVARQAFWAASRGSCKDAPGGSETTRERGRGGRDTTMNTQPTSRRNWLSRHTTHTVTSNESSRVSGATLLEMSYLQGGGKGFHSSKEVHVVGDLDKVVFAMP